MGRRFSLAHDVRREMGVTFANRTEAGRILATRLAAYADDPNVIVLALPRGGVPVAYEVAKALHAPLDVWVVRKLGVPGHEELAMGAAAPGGILVLNDDVVHALEISQESIDQVAQQQQEEIERRKLAYRANRPPPSVDGRLVILIDDGLATGATMRVAVRSLHLHHPARIVIAVPAASRTTCKDLRNEADESICIIMSEAFGSVGRWYDDFPQVTDDEVCDLLQRARLDQAE